MRRMHAKLESLTRREREVLGLIGRGLSLPQIARQLHRSQKTIESHRLSLGRKLDASNRVELARIAITAGLAPLTDANAEQTSRVESLRDSVYGSAPAWRAMRSIDAALATATGELYLNELPRHLCEQLGLRCAFVSELTDDVDGCQAHGFVIAWEGGQYREWENLPITATPCEPVVREGLSNFSDRVTDRFPNDTMLQELHARSYIGVRLNGKDNEPIGVLGLIHDAVLDPSQQAEAILRICASRAAAELERARMDEKFLQLNQDLERRVKERTEQLTHQNEQLRRAQCRLSESERKFRTLVENMNEGLALMNADGIMTYVNPGFCQMLGRPKSELIGRPPTDFIAYAQEAAWFKARDFERRQGTHGSYKVHLRRADGSVVATHVSPRSLYDQQGEYTGSFGLVSRALQQAQTPQNAASR